MIKRIHTVKWKTIFNGKEKDIEFEVVDIDCVVSEVTHPCAKWAIGEKWHIVCKRFVKKNATVILGEKDAN
jgi:hypothetical protein